jgi:hypothetical protein
VCIHSFPVSFIIGSILFCYLFISIIHYFHLQPMENDRPMGVLEHLC